MREGVVNCYGSAYDKLKLSTTPSLSEGQPTDPTAARLEDGHRQDEMCMCTLHLVHESCHNKPSFQQLQVTLIDAHASSDTQ